MAFVTRLLERNLRNSSVAGGKAQQLRALSNQPTENDFDEEGKI